MNKWEDYFSSVYAESSDILPEGFISPEIASIASQNTSHLITGDIGSGRTTLLQYLQTDHFQHTDRIIMKWQPEPPDMLPARETTEMSWLGFQQILRQLAIHLIVRLGRDAEFITRMPDWVKGGVTWFLDTYSPENPQYAIASRASQLDEQAVDLLTAMIQDFANYKPLNQNHGKKDVLQTVNNMIRDGLGIHSIWILVDVKDYSTSHFISDVIESILSNLKLLEQPIFYFKIFVATQDEITLVNTSGSQRDRLTPLSLAWEPRLLWQILQKRYQLATGYLLTEINQFCRDENGSLPKSFMEWLDQVSTNANLTPRKWLRFWQPLLRVYFQKNATGSILSLSEQEWKHTFDTVVSRLHLDFSRQCAFINEEQIDLSEQNYRVMTYLYQNAPRICTKEELYYLAIRNLDQIPNPHSDLWEPPTRWRTTYDSVLNRLRVSIEPDHNHPIYIITIRGRGVVLRNRD